MKTLVDDNYLSYHAFEKRTSSYLATPSQIFQDNDSLDDVDFVMNIMGGTYKELRSLVEKGAERYGLPKGEETYVLNELFKEV